MSDKSYPYFNRYYFGLCHLSAGAEFMVTSKISIVPSVSLWSKSFAGEARLYMPSPKDTTIEPYISTRISTRNRVSVGFGVCPKEYSFGVSPVFGLSLDRNTGAFSPFITFSFGFL